MMQKTYAEQVEDLENTWGVRKKRLDEIAQKPMAEGRSLDASEKEEVAELKGEIKQLEEDIQFYREMDAESRKSATPVTEKREEVEASIKGANKSPMFIVKKTDPDEKFEGQNFTRMCIAKALAKETGASAGVIAEARWGKTHPNLVGVIKADVAGFGSDTGEPGAELVVQDSYMGDFIDYLYGRTIYNQLGLREVPANVKIGEQDGASTAYWVGESKAIPTTSADFNTVNLTHKKVAALAVASKEWLRESSWSAEMLVRDSLVEAARQRIDSTFVSNSAGTTSAPAGILNNIAATLSAGTDGDAVANDIKELKYRFTTAKNSGGQVLVMNPALATGLSLMRNALDQYEFPDISEEGGTLLRMPVYTGDNVNANYLIMLKPSDIYRIGMGSLDVSMSDTATIEMADNPGADTDTPTAPTQKFVGMFQTESVAFKVVMPINFQRRRESAVAWINDADYGGAIST